MTFQVKKGVRRVMAWVRFKKNFPPFEVEEGSNLMTALLEHGRPVGSSCGGEGVCNKCLIQLTHGLEHLSAINELEAKWRSSRPTPPDMRMSCQSEILGDIEVDAGYW